MKGSLRRQYNEVSEDDDEEPRPRKQKASDDALLKRIEAEKQRRLDMGEEIEALVGDCPVPVLNSKEIRQCCKNIETYIANEMASGEANVFLSFIWYGKAGTQFEDISKDVPRLRKWMNKFDRIRFANRQDVVLREALCKWITKQTEIVFGAVVAAWNQDHSRFRLCIRGETDNMRSIGVVENR